MSIQILIQLLMDAGVFVEWAVGCSQQLHRAGAGTGLGTSWFAGMAFEGWFMSWLCCTGVHHVHSLMPLNIHLWRAQDSMLVFPDQGSLLENHERAKLGLKEGDMLLDTAWSSKQ